MDIVEMIDCFSILLIYIIQEIFQVQYHKMNYGKKFLIAKDQSEFICMMDIFSGNNVQCATIIARTDCVGYKLSKKACMELLDSPCLFQPSLIRAWARKFYDACASGDDETVMAKLTEYFDAFSYELIGDEKEKFFHAIFHAVFILAGVYAITEDRGLIGRAGEVIIASDFLWIFELKVDGSADDALKQIEEKGYANKYASMIEQYSLKVRKVGISFSSETKSIAEWECLSE